MPSFTPQQVVDFMHEADNELETLSTQLTWFKAQRDFWKNRLDMDRAAFRDSYNGSQAKAEVAALANVGLDKVIEIPWEGRTLNLPEMVLYCQIGFDWVSNRYQYVHDHLMVLMSVNKNVMADYGRA